MAAIPFILSIHIEPEERLVKTTHVGWPGFLNLSDYLRANRRRLEDATGHPVRFTWSLRLDPQIAHAFGRADWILKRHGAVLEQLMADGDSIGIHVHTWRPVRHWFKRSWVADFHDQDWTEHCIRMAHEAYVRHFGRGPAVASMGDHYMSPRAMHLFDELGIRADNSMYPGMNPTMQMMPTEKTRGSLPDYRHLPEQAFKPSVTDFSRPGPAHHRVWAVPLSAGKVRHPVSGETMHHCLLLGSMPDWVEGIVTHHLRRSAAYLHGEARTDVRMVPDNRTRFDWALDYLARCNPKGGLRFVTLDEYCDSLDRETNPAGA